MSMPWTCDALRPTAERYASIKFRRFAPTVADLQWGDAAELVAFLGCVGLRAGRWIFQWDRPSARYAAELVKGLGNDVDVVAMLDANMAGVEIDDGLACLVAMRDGGWRQGSIPPIVRMTLLEMRNRGLSYAAVGDQTGLTVDQVRVACNGVRTGRVTARRGRAASLLAVG